MIHLQRQDTYKRLTPKTREFIDDYLQNVLKISKYSENASSKEIGEIDLYVKPMAKVGNIAKLIDNKKYDNAVIRNISGKESEKESQEAEKDIYFDNFNVDFMDFLFPKFEESLHNPYDMKNMQKAVEKIVDTILSNKKICIYGDYDCDGVPGTALMRDFFEAIKYENVLYYIPDRHKEGYGLNMTAIEYIKLENVNLIITLDLGTTNIKEIEKINDLGMEVIVTDHHLPMQNMADMDGEELPKAYAILNTKQAGCNYKDKNLCGSGVIYKLILAILEYNTKNNIWKIGNGFHKWILDLVAIATIADMVPLIGENRTLAIYGLHVLKNTKRDGLRTLITNAKADINKITEDDIGFTIAPRINAASRMLHPKIAFEMLGQGKQNIQLSIDSAHKLEELNTLRKGTTKNIMKKVYKVLNERKTQEEEADGGKKEVIVIGDSSWSAGVLGIIASNIVDKYGKTTFVFGGSEKIGDKEIFKGSVRTNGQAHVVQLMTEVKDLLEHFGGHAEAGGFTIDFKNLMKLEIELNREENLSKAKIVKADNDLNLNNENIFEIDLEDVSSEMIAGLSLLGPFGVGNRKPKFKIRDLVSFEFVRFGKTNEHIKVMLQSRNTKREAIAFFTDHEKEKTLSENFHLASFELEPGWRSGPPRLKII